MQNLRDKLLKAGLVTEDQAKKTDSEPPPRKERPSSPPGERSGPPRDASRPQGDRPHGERPQGPRGDRPQGFRGERPQGFRGGGGPRPSGGGGPRPSGGGRPAMSGGGRPPPPRGAPVDESRIPKLPPMPGSKAAQRMESRKQLETDKKLRELVQAHQVPVEPGARTFYFVTRKNRLRRLEVSEDQARMLETGKLAVVERPEPAQIEHSLVPPEVAEQMLAISPKAVRFLNRGEAPVGFISDEELKTRQEAEKNAGPEEEAPEAAAESAAGEEAGAAEASAPEAAAASAPEEPGPAQGEPSAG